MLPMLPNNFSQIAERIQRKNNRSLKDLFKNDIRGSFLIDIKYRVLLNNKRHSPTFMAGLCLFLFLI